MIERYKNHAANERTFLAWVRTAIAVVGLGIAGARLGGSDSGDWADVLVLVSGAIVVVLAYARMRRVRRRIDSDEIEPDQKTNADVLLGFLVIAFFGMLGAFALRLIL